MKSANLKNMKSIIREAFRILYFFSPIILFFVLSAMTLTRDDIDLKVQTKKPQVHIRNEINMTAGRLDLPGNK
jgi:hypothetical protein